MLPLLAMSLQHGTEGNHISLYLLCLHIFQDLWKVLHPTAASMRIDDGVEGHDRKLDLLVRHFLVDCPHTANLPRAPGDLEDRAKDD